MASRNGIRRARAAGRPRPADHGRLRGRRQLSLATEIERLITGYPGVITATTGLVALIGVTVTSLVIVRRRLSYETWYFVHLYAYLGIALAFSHQLATGVTSSAIRSPAPTGSALYIATLARDRRLPARRSRSSAALRHRLRVASVSEEAPGVVSLEIGGARSTICGAHRPVLLLALPDARALVAVAPVLAVGGARRPAAADHGQARRRLQPGCARCGRARE